MQPTYSVKPTLSSKNNSCPPQQFIHLNSLNSKVLTVFTTIRHCFQPILTTLVTYSNRLKVHSFILWREFSLLELTRPYGCSQFPRNFGKMNKSTRCHNPEYSGLHLYRCEKLKPRTNCITSFYAADEDYLLSAVRDWLLNSFAVYYRVIHKSLRDFRTRLRNNQDKTRQKGAYQQVENLSKFFFCTRGLGVLPGSTARGQS